MKTAEKPSVIIAEFNGAIVTYLKVDDCYECPYDKGGKDAEDKYIEHECYLTGEHLHPAGMADIDIPETCPFPVAGIDIDFLSAGIIGRYPGINDTNHLEIKDYVKATHKAGFSQQGNKGEPHEIPEVS